MKLVGNLVALIAGLKRDYTPIAQDLLKGTFAKMNLVTREEFEAQTKVLAKAQQTLTELQLRLKSLQNKQD